MGRPFLEHMGGSKLILCKKCKTPLTNAEHLESSEFKGSTGKAYLFSKVVNLKTGECQERNMMTGKHYVRDVYCKVCDEKIGWMYELAVPKEQRHKEGKVILEKYFIQFM